jgi:hypothetical protein
MLYEKHERLTRLFRQEKPLCPKLRRSSDWEICSNGLHREAVIKIARIDSTE